jgi:hypothetical protein
MLNKVEHNYTTIGKEALVMVCAMHKFRHFLLGFLFLFLCRPHGSSILGQQIIGAWKDS